MLVPLKPEAKAVGAKTKATFKEAYAIGFMVLNSSPGIYSKAILIGWTIWVSCSVAAANLEEQVLEVSTINGAILSEPIIGSSKGSDLYLPLLDLATVLGIKIEEVSEGVFKIFQTESEFQMLDVKDCTQKAGDLACRSFLFNKGIYLFEHQFIKENLAWPITVDLKQMQITVNVETRSREAVNRAKSQKASRPVVTDRKWLGAPAVRFEAAVATDPTKNSLNLYAAHPFLNHDSDLFVSGSERNKSIRWTLSRENPNSQGGGVKSYELLSTQTVDTKYIFSPTQILGMNVTNVGRNESVFDTQNLYEKGPPRWKVELYVNESYFGETTVDANGDYSFLSVPIFYGQNRLRYKFTSPLGKTSQVEKTYAVGQEFEGAGKLKYQAAIGQEVGQSEFIGSGVMSYGLTGNVSGQVGMASATSPTNGLRQNYILSGVSWLQPTYSLSLLNLNSTTGNGRALLLSPKFSFGKILLNGEYAKYSSFKSRLVNPGLNERQTESGKVSALTMLEGKVPIATQFTYLGSAFANVKPNRQVQGRAYGYFKSSSVLLESAKTLTSSASPSLYAEYGRYSPGQRGRLGVLIQDDRYSKTKIEYESLLKRGFFLTVGVESPTKLSDSAFVTGLSKVFGEIQFEGTITRTLSEFVFGLTASSNLKFDENRYRFSHEENYKQAHAILFAYVDENGNGRFDEGEKPYERLRILHVQRQKEFETAMNGEVIVTGLSPYERVSFEVVKESIGNIFLSATDPATDFMPTPAQKMRMEFPIKPVFDVRGVIQNRFFKKLVPLELYNLQDELISSTVTTASGRYRFSDVSPGKYRISINNKFIHDNKLSSSPAVIEVEIFGKAGVRTCPDLKLVRK